ncbi:MAG TPA: hypothetical protein VFP59_18635 [Candidatus Angelobacter sp.]|nr:hypothetical protein [Candidatus Angelobacter sp.]
MKHLSEQEIVLHFYGDAEDEGSVRQHLLECSHCRGEFERIQDLLGSIPPLEVPEPDTYFENKVWLNVRDRLPSQVPARSVFRTAFQGTALQKWALGGIMALLLAVAFIAGRFWPGRDHAKVQNAAVTDPQRIVLLAVSGHLERSQMLLVEIMNADDQDVLDHSTRQQARELLDSNHLYRLSAQQAGDPRIVYLLDQLGRVLAEVANNPAQGSASELREIREHIQSEGLLFKVRVVDSEVNSEMRRHKSNPAAANQRL